MRKSKKALCCFLLLIALAAGIAVSAAPLSAPSYEKFTAEGAARFNRSARTALAPVYPYLAEYLVKKFDLSGKGGIGIDLGSGPGHLVIELARRTKSMYWINADINPHYFEYFFKSARVAKLAHRVGAVFADAQHLPFRKGYADVIVSRGSFQFWEDRKKGFAEVYRVLKPGGVAFIGRGFSENLPVETAVKVRKNQGKGGPKYDVAQTGAQLEKLMADLKIAHYKIIRPKTNQTKVNYGIWIEFTKPGE